jgi:hypothetical protein
MKTTPEMQRARENRQKVEDFLRETRDARARHLGVRRLIEHIYRSRIEELRRKETRQEKSEENKGV